MKEKERKRKEKLFEKWLISGAEKLRHFIKQRIFHKLNRDFIGLAEN